MGRYRRYTQAVIDEVMRRRDNGESAYTVAREMGIPAGSVDAIIHGRVKPVPEGGVQRRPVRRLPDEAVRDVLQKYRDGINTTEIINEYSMNPTELYDLVHWAGLPLRGRHCRINDAALMTSAYEMYVELKWPVSKIVRELKISVGQLYLMLNALDVPLRKSRSGDTSSLGTPTVIEDNIQH